MNFRYAIPPDHGKRLEILAQGFFPDHSQRCNAFLRHKTILISPIVLKNHGIPFQKVTQEAGEFIITFPYGYHAGFNHGFNCAESINFATLRWIDFGKAAQLCVCRKDMVIIPMDIFVRKFQSDQLSEKDKDVYTDDDTNPTPQSTSEEQKLNCLLRDSANQSPERARVCLLEVQGVSSPGSPSFSKNQKLFHFTIAMCFFCLCVFFLFFYELPETTLTEEEFQEIQTWARPLVYLWQSKAPNFNAEKEYNTACAKKEPKCAICYLFVPCNKTENHDEENTCLGEANSAKMLMVKQRKTKPLIPEMCFIYSEENTKNNPSTAFVEEDGTSLLISCAKCCIGVHASCYGVLPHEIQDEWLCSRCRKEAWTAECCLCTLRGGALKETTDEKWAHVVCAIAIPEVRFVNVRERALIDISGIPLEKFKLKCVFCSQRIKNISGVCIQCSCGSCSTSFHVTCGHAGGVIMGPGDWPHVVYVMSCRQNIKQNLIPKACEKAITVGQTIITKHRNKRYYSCKVINVQSQLFYEVLLDDDSLTWDICPENILSRDCLALGPPAEGEVVQVKWPDGKVYVTRYVGSKTTHRYQVEFEDGSGKLVKSKEIYTLDEKLPKNVEARFSTASDMRFEDTFYGDGIMKEKRQRVLSSRFKDECVDDPGYRTFLKRSFQKKE
ncbi:lysine-specific demethylase 4C-like [Porphyrio hochstetteri]